MTTISKDADLITLINVFAVDPSNQSRLVELLTTVTDRFVRHARGFISSSLHRSRDGTKVTMYAQWRSLDDYETMRRDPGPVPYLQEALTIAKFEPGIYDVVESFAPRPDPISWTLSGSIDWTGLFLPIGSPSRMPASVSMLRA